MKLVGLRDSLPNTAESEPGSSQGGGRRVWQGRLDEVNTHCGQATRKVASDIREYIFLSEINSILKFGQLTKYTAKLNLFYIFSSGNSSKKQKINFLFFLFEF